MGCSGDCSSCSSKCENEIKKEKLSEFAVVKKVYAVMSGKGGVGKSLVTSMLAVSSQRMGFKSAILDADLTGPSIPKAFGLKEKAMGDNAGIYPVLSKTGVQVMSLNLLVENETDPAIWRGPVIAGVVKQFWTDVLWKDVDYMYVDMPPGTGDVPLTVMQSLPVDGVIIVTSPQELVEMIVEKAVKMTKMLNVPIVGIVENMSYFECPNCGEKHYIFGQSRVDEVAKKYGIPVIAKMPFDSSFASKCDKGEIETFESTALEELTDSITK